MNDLISLINLRLVQEVGESKLPKNNLGILTLYALLNRANLDVLCLDGDANDLSDDEIFSEVCIKNPKIIGFSPTQITMQRTIDLILKILENLSKPYIVLGGHHVSMVATEIMKDVPQVDFIIVGDSDTSFLKLIHILFYGIVKEKKHVDGLVFRKNGKISINKPKAFQNLDDLPNIGMNQVITSNNIGLITSRGCSSNCNFCVTPAYQRLYEYRILRMQSPNSIINQILDLINIDPNKVLSFHFHDADFLGLSNESVQRANEIAKAIFQIKICAEFRFACQVRGVINAGIDFWKRWKSAGLVKVYCGFESGNDIDLELFNKSQSVDENIKAYEILKDCNIGLQIGFIMFTPYSDTLTLKMNLNFLKRIDQIHIYKNITTELQIYPGSSLFRRLQSENLLEVDKVYLPITIKYTNLFIKEIKNELFKNRQIQFEIDRICLEFDFAITSKKNSINLNDTVIPLTDLTICEYSNYKRKRGDIILFEFSKSLSSDTTEIQMLYENFNNKLMSEHNKFVKKLTKVNNLERRRSYV